MAHQSNLSKAAGEFVVIDGQVRKMERQAQENRMQTYQPKTIDAKEAAKRYGGVMHVTGRRPVGGVLREGGVGIVDYSKKKNRVMAY